jgi:1-phosphofructokinase family hexose kinase
MKTILTVTLNPALDQIIHDDQRSGHERSVQDVQVFPGGKGVNVTRALQALGIHSTTMIAVAGANGHSLVRGLRVEGLSFAAFELSSGETRVNRTSIENLSGRVTRALAPGPRWCKKDERHFREFFRKALCRTRLLVLSGRMPPGLSVNFYADLIREAGAQGVPVFLDTSGPALKAGLKAQPFAAKPNQKEAEELLGYRLVSRRNIRKALLSFLDCGMKMVLLTLGEQGLAAGDENSLYIVRAPKIHDGHAVGCGDAALAGFIAGWDRQAGLATCARLAAACGAANLLGDVPGGITENVLKRIAAKVVVEGL